MVFFFSLIGKPNRWKKIHFLIMKSNTTRNNINVEGQILSKGWLIK